MQNKENIIYADFKTRFLAGVVDAIIVIFLSLFVIRIFNLAGMEINIVNQNNEIVSIFSIVDTIKKEKIEETKTTEITKAIKTKEKIELNFDKKTRKYINAIFICIAGIYSVYFVSSKKQGTPGKQLFKIMIIDEKEGRMTIFNAFIRFIAKKITNTLFFIGYLPILFTKEKVSLHDFLSRTRVVHIKLKEKND